MIKPEYKEMILRALEYHFPGAKVILFGSRARGDNKPASDIDLAVDADGKPVDFRELFRAKNTLENLNMPYKTDLVDVNGVVDELRAVILKEGIRWK